MIFDNNWRRHLDYLRISITLICSRDSVFALSHSVLQSMKWSCNLLTETLLNNLSVERFCHDTDRLDSDQCVQIFFSRVEDRLPSRQRHERVSCDSWCRGIEQIANVQEKDIVPLVENCSITACLLIGSWRLGIRGIWSTLVWRRFHLTFSMITISRTLIFPLVWGAKRRFIILPTTWTILLQMLTICNARLKFEYVDKWIVDGCQQNNKQICSWNFKELHFSVH